MLSFDLGLVFDLRLPFFDDEGGGDGDASLRDIREERKCVFLAYWTFL